MVCGAFLVDSVNWLALISRCRLTVSHSAIHSYGLSGLRTAVAENGQANTNANANKTIQNARAHTAQTRARARPLN